MTVLLGNIIIQIQQWLKTDERLRNNGDYKNMPTEEYYDKWITTTDMKTGSRVWSRHMFPNSREYVRKENVSEKYCA